VDPHKDFDRLVGQTKDIFELMKDQSWRTLAEIETILGYPQASISAQLRHLRKLRFGGHTVEKRRRNDGAVWEYQLIERTFN
jgi:DNA-binding transcriptional regulator GbsR (MarR family)